jgi:hypothetical protein
MREYSDGRLLEHLGGLLETLYLKENSANIHLRCIAIKISMPSSESKAKTGALAMSVGAARPRLSVETS